MTTHAKKRPHRIAPAGQWCGLQSQVICSGATVLVSVMLCSFISMMMSMNCVTMRSMGVMSTLL